PQPPASRGPSGPCVMSPCSPLKVRASQEEHWLPTLLHARTDIERWRREYNEHRPKKTIGAMTPAAYAQQLANSDIITPGL
ncbi:integrase core domain-containing protein, partial [Xanthomonas oryzae]|uniref:integrase core domain-containing protein n=1 Tax=Xanthomonas oryzae TaxID=347 RepID=UPI00215C529A